MTEQEWNESSDPVAMLQAVVAPYESPTGGLRCAASYRKLRLFACACCRAVWHLLTDERCRKCIEAAERYADDPSAIISPYYDDAAERFEEMDNSGQGELWNAVLARHVYHCNIRDSFVENVAGTIVPAVLRKQKTTPIVIANLLRDIIGNPFQPIIVNEGTHTLATTRGIVLDRRWLTPTVVALATAAYSERGRVCGGCKGKGWYSYNGAEFGYTTTDCEDCHGTGRVEDGTLDNARLAVLADALEDAGCEDGTILLHLRSDGVHVRGCWVLDFLLGKQ